MAFKAHRLWNDRESLPCLIEWPDSVLCPKSVLTLPSFTLIDQSHLWSSYLFDKTDNNKREGQGKDTALLLK